MSLKFLFFKLIFTTFKKSQLIFNISFLKPPKKIIKNSLFHRCIAQLHSHILKSRHLQFYCNFLPKKRISHTQELKLHPRPFIFGATWNGGGENASFSGHKSAQ